VVQRTMRQKDRGKAGRITTFFLSHLEMDFSDLPTLTHKKCNRVPGTNRVACLLFHRDPSLLGPPATPSLTLHPDLPSHGTFRAYMREPKSIFLPGKEAFKTQLPLSWPVVITSPSVATGLQKAPLQVPASSYPQGWTRDG
jgi:hypothetical protein